MTISEILKEQGLDIAEDAAVATVKGVFKALPAILAVTENKYDDMLIPVLGLLEPQVIGILDKIDGEDDPEY